MNKHTKKQLNELENEQRFTQKPKAKKKTVVKKRTPLKKAQTAVVSSAQENTKAPKASAAEIEQTSLEIEQTSLASKQQDPPSKIEPNEAAIEAAALEWALTVVKHNLTSKWIKEEI